jgi:hypothetical protein
MVEDGYLEAGYEYIIVDDCWLAMTRDKNNRLQPGNKMQNKVEKNNLIY